MDVKEQGLAYVEDENGYSRYTVYLESRRVVDVLVDLGSQVAVPEGATLDPDFTLHPISIAMVDAPVTAGQATKGFAAAALNLEEAGFMLRVQPSSISSYVVPRLPALIARLFVPPAA